MQYIIRRKVEKANAGFRLLRPGLRKNKGKGGVEMKIVAAFFELFKAIFMLVGWVIMIGCVLTKNNR